MANTSRWKILNPEGIVRSDGKNTNPHPKDLDEKTVALYWTGKPNGDILLNRLAELLKNKYRNLNLLKVWEILPESSHALSNHAESKNIANKIAALKPDIVIGALGDCSGSTTWLITDLLNIERLGIPTVAIITQPYFELASTIPTSEGFSQACIVSISHPVGSLKPEEVKQKIEAFFKDILNAITTWELSEIIKKNNKYYPAEEIVLTGTVKEINDLFFEKCWSLGLPITPPTKDLVNQMLASSPYNPDTIIGLVPPRMGVLTIELAAVHAVMANCRPEYFTILVSALQSLLDPKANLRMALCGTGTSQIIIIINGPIVKETGIAYQQGAAGKGHKANATIGYAINLIGYIVGKSIPPAIDRSTLGSPADFVCWVIGENEDALPDNWSPFHFERGFKKNESAVTVMCSYPPIENVDHWSKSAEEHLNWWGKIVNPLLNMGAPAVPEIIRQNPMVMLCPEHASLISSSGWDKNEFRKRFWEVTRLPLSSWPDNCPAKKQMLASGKYKDGVPICENPEQLLIVVAGGDGKQSHYFAPFPGSFPVSNHVLKRLTS